jgi:hypothetical protein
VTPRSTEGLLASTKRRKAETRAKVRKALREMKKKGLPININAVANYALVARKTIYNHPDLEQEIRAAATTAAPRSAEPPAAIASGQNSATTAALRNELRSQKHHYDADITALKSQIKQLQQELAAAHGELHRLRTKTAPQRGTP